GKERYSDFGPHDSPQYRQIEPHPARGPPSARRTAAIPKADPLAVRKHSQPCQPGKPALPRVLAEDQSNPGSGGATACVCPPPLKVEHFSSRACGGRKHRLEFSPIVNYAPAGFARGSV